MAANRALALDPNSAVAHRTLGWAASISLDWEAAENYVDKADALDPGSKIICRIADAWAHLARSLVTLPSWADHFDNAAYNARAKVAANRALALDPNSAVAHRTLGWAASISLDWEAAENYVDKADALDPGSKIINKPGWLLSKGYLAAAVEAGQKALDVDENNSFLHVIKGLALASQGRWEESLPFLSRSQLLGYGSGYIATLDYYVQEGRVVEWEALAGVVVVANDPAMMPLLPMIFTGIPPGSGCGCPTGRPSANPNPSAI